MPQITWLALGYNAPAEPSKHRVYVWRKLKEYGAGYFRPGVAILPLTQGNMARMRLLAAKIKELGGEAVIAELKFCDFKDEADTVARFKKASANEYNEIAREGREISDISPAQRVDHLKKLAKRYGKVKERDFFSAGDSVTQGLIDLADDMERVATGLGRELRRLLDL